MKNFVKNFLNFIKNNVFLIFAAYWLVDFVISLITFNPSALDDTTRRIKVIQLVIDMLWFTVLFSIYNTSKIIKHLYELIKLVNKKVDLIADTIDEAVKLVAEEDEASDSADDEEKDIK